MITLYSIGFSCFWFATFVPSSRPPVVCAYTVGILLYYNSQTLISSGIERTIRRRLAGIFYAQYTGNSTYLYDDNMVLHARLWCGHHLFIR